MRNTRTTFLLFAIALFAGDAAAQRHADARASIDFVVTTTENAPERQIKRIKVDAKEIRDVDVSQTDGRAVVYVNGVKVRELPPVEGREIVEIVDSEGVRRGVFIREGGTVLVRTGDDVNIDQIDEVVRALERRVGNGAYRDVDPFTGAPPVMVGVSMVSPAPERALEGTGLESKEVTYISDVIDGLPAQKAGLRKGDVIVKIGDEDSGDAETLRSVLREKSPGETLKVIVLREGDRKEFVLGLEAYKREALSGNRGRARVEVREWDSRNSEIVKKIEKLEEEMVKLGAKMKSTTDPRKLQEFGAKMGHLGAEIGQLSAKLAMEELRHSRVIEELRAIESIEAPDAPQPPRVVIPEWPEGEEAQGAFRLFMAPKEGEGYGQMRELMERLAERTTRTDEQMEAYQERLESLMERFAESGDEARTFRFQGRSSLDDRLDKFDERLGRLESMIERLLEDRQDKPDRH